MRVLIVGGTRFIGPYVVRELVRMGHQIRLFHRGIQETDLCETGQCIHADRADILGHLEVFSQFMPEVVLDMIPVSEADALDTVRAFQGLAGRLVGISSQDVYRAYGVLIGIEDGPVEPVPLSEESPLRGTLFPYRTQVDREHRLYDYDKIKVEDVYMGNPDLPGTILRLPMVYGPGDYQHRLFPYLKRMDDGRPAIILEARMADWRWTKGYVENIARAIVLAVIEERAVGEIYNLGEADPLPEIDWVKAIGQGHLKSPINTKQQLVTDTGKIRADLGYVDVIPREEALARTIAWERQNPPAEIDQKQFDYAAEDALLDKKI
jgi:nucleoside-diphosphate-sugar epimerase